MDIKLALEAAKNAGLNGYLSWYPRACMALADALNAQGVEVVGRVYIAGPMTGYTDLNFPAFHAAASRLRACGWEVINPAEINPDANAKWEDCMRRDIAAMMTCSAIYMLDGWEQSRGAALEFHIASRLSFTVFKQNE